MITIAFLVMLTFLVLSANRLLLDSATSTLSSEAIDLGVDFAQGLLVEAVRKKFDNTCYAGQTTKPAFTPASSLGPESGESIGTLPESAPFLSPTRYNDIDDYNGYSRIVDGTQIKGFIVSASVYYVSSVSNTTTKVTSASPWPDFKRIDVTVEHPLYLPNKITFSRVMTY